MRTQEPLQCTSLKSRVTHTEDQYEVIRSKCTLFLYIVPPYANVPSLTFRVITTVHSEVKENNKTKQTSDREMLHSH